MFTKRRNGVFQNNYQTIKIIQFYLYGLNRHEKCSALCGHLAGGPYLPDIPYHIISKGRQVVL
jgi:hypothetical protein